MPGLPAATRGLLVAVALTAGAAHAQFVSTPETARNYGTQRVGALSAWNFGAMGQGVVVAVIDTGISPHAEFAGRLLPGYDFVNDDATPWDDSWASHGTFIAGIIGASLNGVGMAGVAPRSRLLPVKVLDETHRGPEINFAHGVDFAIASGARVINVSIARENEDEAVPQALERAREAGLAVILAAGNRGARRPLPYGGYVYLLGAQGLVVGATDTSNRIVTTSNRAGGLAHFFVVAPAAGITSTTRSGGYFTEPRSGTSWATAHVSGVVALVMSAFPNLTAAQAVQIVKRSATDLGDPGVDPIYGWGLVSARNALRPLGAVTAPPPGADVTNPPADDPGGEGEHALVEADRQLVGAGIDVETLAGHPLLRDVLVLDGFRRIYSADLSATVAPRRPAPDLGQLMGDPTFRHWETQTGSTHLGFGFHAPPRRDAARYDAFADDPQTDDDWALSIRAPLTPGWWVGVHRGAGSDLPRALAGLDSRLDAARREAAGGLGDRASRVALSRSLGPRLEVSLAHSTASRGEAGDGAAESLVADLDWHGSPSTRATFRLSRVTERGRLLGGSAGGALSVARSRTDGASVSIGRILAPGTRGFLSASFARTDVDSARGSFLQEVTRLDSEAFTAGLTSRDVWRHGDSLTVALSSPLRVTRGDATLRVPTGVSNSGRFTFEQARVDLAPEATEVDLELQWSTPLGEQSRLGAYLLLRQHAEHRESAGRESAFVVTLNGRW